MLYTCDLEYVLDEKIDFAQVKKSGLIDLETYFTAHRPAHYAAINSAIKNLVTLIRRRNEPKIDQMLSLPPIVTTLCLSQKSKILPKAKANITTPPIQKIARHQKSSPKAKLESLRTSKVFIIGGSFYYDSDAIEHNFDIVTAPTAEKNIDLGFRLVLQTNR